MFVVYSLWFGVWRWNFQSFEPIELIEPFELFIQNENNFTIPP
jgi:hypothetical protein